MAHRFIIVNYLTHTDEVINCIVGLYLTKYVSVLSNLVTLSNLNFPQNKCVQLECKVLVGEFEMMELNFEEAKNLNK